jgi:hypothetical protein
VNTTVTSGGSPKLDIIRAACSLLFEIPDPSAIEPLKRLAKENLNWVSVTNGSSTSWAGRPDVVALTRMGDFSSIEILRKSISDGDPLGAAGHWGGSGDYVKIGLKRFIPDIIPLLDDHRSDNRIHAAQAIVQLLEIGR